MPVIEQIVLSPSSVPGVVDQPRMNPGAAAAPGEAIARGADKLFGVAEHFQQRYDNARREADGASLQAESMKRLGEARVKWSQVPDSKEARAGFDKEAETIKADIAGRINDPYVALQFAPHFDSRAAAESTATRGTAFMLESSRRKGELLTILDQYAHSMAAATTPLERQQIQDTADLAINAYERGGWIHGEDAAKLRLTTRSKADEVLARQLINADPTGAVPLLGDAKNFPNLDEKTREVLERQAISRADTIARQKVAAGEKKERDDERQLKISQGLAEIELFAQIGSDNPPTLSAVMELGRQRKTSPEGTLAARRAILSGEQGRDEPNFVNGLHARILSGEASLAEIRDAPLGSISSKTKGGFMDLWANKQNGGPFGSRDYRDGLDSLKAAIVTTGPGSQFVRSDEQVKLTRARRELDDWMRTEKVGADDTPRIWQKIDEMLPRYQSAPPSVFGLPRPRLGEIKTRQDVDAVAAATAAALTAGQISDGDAQAEDRLLSEYLGIFNRQEELARLRQRAQESTGRGGRATKDNARKGGE